MNPSKDTISATVSLAQKDADLGLSWSDTINIPHLTSANVLMGYFAQLSNPFYDPHCNNEVIKMQQRHNNLDQLRNMIGIEYELVHAQEGILYIIKKQQRISPTETVTLAHYYVLAGIVYRAPDLWSLINSRLLNTSHFLCSAAAELNSFVRYHPSNGYHWEIKNPPNSTKMSFVPIDPAKKEPEDAGTQFQRKNVDLILGSLTQRFPFKQMPTTQHPYGPRLPADQLHSTREVAPSLTPGSLPAEPTPATQNQNKTGPDHQLFNTVKGGR